MGMTDRQYDSHQKYLLRELERIRKEAEELTGGKKIESLDKLIKDTEDDLKRP
jgi:hypothetical protein